MRFWSMYKTKPLEKALQSVFENRPLFGGVNNQGYMLKVAVTSTTLVDQKPIILANYNRPDDQDISKIVPSHSLPLFTLILDKYAFER